MTSIEQSKFEEFDSYDRPSKLTQIHLDSNHQFFSQCDLEIWWITLKNNKVCILYYMYVKLCASFQSHRWIQTGVTVWKRSIRVKKQQFFAQCHLEIWQMTLKTNRAPLLYYIKLCVSFQSHGWIQTGVTVRKRSIRVKICDFFCPVWPWNLKDDLEKQ